MIDVCLLLEGTYPYVSGGVSTWVHQLLTFMRDVRFSVVSIVAHDDPTRVPKYTLPPNVHCWREVCLHACDPEPGSPNPTLKKAKLLENFLRNVIRQETLGFDEFVRRFQEAGTFDVAGFFSSAGAWGLLEEAYDEKGEGMSFLDFFWTSRAILLPALQILNSRVPPAKVYHAVSTGYAGLLGATASALHGGKLLITEHGIYNHERSLELSQADWIFEEEQPGFCARPDMPLLKRWWMAFFDLMGRITYERADHILTLYEGNRLRQIAAGADPGKTSIIPNGIDLNAYREIVRDKRPHPQIGLVGRMVAIKDVKTFIEAAFLVLKKIPDAEFYAIGPTDEEPDYFQECKDLVEKKDLAASFRFTGRVKIVDYYRFLDVVVLTSVSEAQPYVILEAGLAGIPVVCTDVGACREMIEGLHGADRALGPGGVVTEVADPASTAEALIKLIKDPNFYAQCGRAGGLRVRRFYDQDDLMSRYLNLYERNF